MPLREIPDLYWGDKFLGAEGKCVLMAVKPDEVIYHPKNKDDANKDGLEALENLVHKWMPSNEATIISMVVFRDVLYVATSEGVYFKDGNGEFHKMKIA